MPLLLVGAIPETNEVEINLWGGDAPALILGNDYPSSHFDTYLKPPISLKIVPQNDKSYERWYRYKHEFHHWIMLAPDPRCVCHCDADSLAPSAVHFKISIFVYCLPCNVSPSYNDFDIIINWIVFFKNKGKYTTVSRESWDNQKWPPEEKGWGSKTWFWPRKWFMVGMPWLWLNRSEPICSGSNSFSFTTSIILTALLSDFCFHRFLRLLLTVQSK